MSGESFVSFPLMKAVIVNTFLNWNADSVCLSRPGTPLELDRLRFEFNHTFEIIIIYHQEMFPFGLNMYY